MEDLFELVVDCSKPMDDPEHAVYRKLSQDEATAFKAEGAANMAAIAAADAEQAQRLAALQEAAKRNPDMALLMDYQGIPRG